MNTPDPRRAIVVIDDHESWLSALRDEFSRIRDVNGLEILYCSEDREAEAFVRANPERVIGYIQDLGRGSESRPWNLAGMRFFEEVIDRFTPQARTVVVSGAITHKRLRDLVVNRPDKVNFISKHMFESKIFAERIRWLLSGVLAAEFGSEREEGLIHSVLLPWRQIYKGIAIDPKQLDLLSARRFEELVARVFEEHGWNVELTARTKDGGYDIIAVRRSLPTDFRILIEAKRRRPDRKIGVGIVRALYGIKVANAASQVVLATTSYVSSYAKREHARLVPWELDFLERDRLVEWCKGRAGLNLGGDLGIAAGE